MNSFKEKVLSLVGGGVLMGGLGLTKGMTRSLSHDTRFVSKIESMNFVRQSRDLAPIERSLPGRPPEGFIASAVHPTIIRTTIHSIPKWEDIFGGVEPFTVNTFHPQNAQLPKPTRPLSVDLRLWDNPVTSQGSEGSCTAYATVAAMENELNQVYKGKVKLSEKSLWSLYKVPHITSAIQNAQGNSRTFVRLHSFNGYPLKNGAWIAYIDNPAAMMSIKNTDEILDLLAANHPVILTTSVNESFDQGKTGWIDPGSPNTGTGHAVTVVGYKLDPARPHLNYFIIRNSWGSQWGDQGYGYLPVAYCEKYHCAGFAVKNVRMENMDQKIKNTANRRNLKFTTLKLIP